MNAADGGAVEHELLETIHTYANITVGYGPLVDDEPVSAEERAHDIEQDFLFRGLFTYASTIVIDELYGDIVTLCTDQDATLSVTMQLDNLPPAMAGQYDHLFAQAFLVAVASVSQKFVEGWSPAACIAEELAVRLILDQALVISEIAGLTVDPIHDHLDRLLEDADHEWLYTGQARYLGARIYDVHTWFEPFKEGRHVSPYARLDLDRSLSEAGDDRD